MEIFYFMAFGLFLLGSAFSFRSHGSRGPVAAMACGVVADAALRLQPGGGFSGVPGDLIAPAVTAGMLTVWPAFLFALLLRKRRRIHFFHRLVTGIEMVWFLDIILLVYGIYGHSPGQ